MSPSQIGRVNDAPTAKEAYARHCLHAARFGWTPKDEATIKAAWKAERAANRRQNSTTVEPAPNSREAIIASLLAELGVEVPGMTEAAPVVQQAEGFKVGTRFAYTSKGGNRREHEVVRISKGRVITDQGQRFRIATLNGVAAEQVELL